MDYILLTPSHKLQLLTARLLEYEVQHFQMATEARLSAEIGDEAGAQASQNKADQFSKLIEITRLDFADAQNEFNDAQAKAADAILNGTEN